MDDGIDPSTVQAEISAVWEHHDDEDYRRDQSHWRGVGRWDEQNWENIGVATMRRVEDLYFTAKRKWTEQHPPVMLEWGPGGGANLYAFADRTAKMYGIDISEKNLAESQRVLTEKPDASFVPIHLTREPSSVIDVIDEPVDLVISSAVFQHFPTKEYGADVLEAMYAVMAPRALGYVQIRYDDGTERYRPKDLSEYRKQHITANSYALPEFWDLLRAAGFRPLKISNLNTKVNYASFYFVRPKG